MCFILGLKCILVVAKTMHALLSSKTLDGGRMGVWILSTDVGLPLEIEHQYHELSAKEEVSRELLLIGLYIHFSWLRESAVSLCNLLHHTMEQLQYMITYPALDKTLSLHSLYSLCQFSAKSAPAYMR
jgi:hypothetical protein